MSERKKAVSEEDKLQTRSPDKRQLITDKRTTKCFSFIRIMGPSFRLRKKKWLDA